MPFEPDWGKILSHYSVTNQLKEYHRQIAPYLIDPVTEAESLCERVRLLKETSCQDDTSQDEDHEKQE